MSIFVSVASYSDPELKQTIQSAIDNSCNPEALHFGIFEQSQEPTEVKSSQSLITNQWVHQSEAKGAGWARSMVQKQYDQEEYFLQIDAHSIFVQDWDRKLYEWKDRIPFNKSIISGWPMPYSYVNDEIVLDRHSDVEWSCQEPHWTQAVRFGRSWVGARRPLNEEDYHWSEIGLGGLWFCKGSFIEEVPYDPRIPWHSEEFLLSLRAFDAGWEIYGVNETFIYHNYVRGGNPRIWDGKKGRWNNMQKQSIGIQADMINLKDTSKFRLRNPQRLEEWMFRSKNKRITSESWNMARRAGVR